jgi:nucleotide-binding universal stress UspA family protein
MNRILVGLDGSARERGVLKAAAALATKTGAKLVLVRSVGLSHDVPPEAYSMSPDDVMKTLEARAKKSVEELAATLPTGIVASIRVQVGTPWPTIERCAKEEDVDLIVIGSHGYDALDRVLGTTAAKVVNHATCSVLVVRQPERFQV